MKMEDKGQKTHSFLVISRYQEENRTGSFKNGDKNNIKNQKCHTVFGANILDTQTILVWLISQLYLTKLKENSPPETMSAFLETLLATKVFN